MDANTAYLFASAASLLIMAFLAVREARSKKDSNVATAIKQLAEALNLQGDELVESLAEAAKLRDIVEETKRQVNQLTNQQRENMAEIDILKTQNGQLREKIDVDTKETEHLSNEVNALRRQVADSDAKYRDLEKKYANSKSAIELLVKALMDAKVPLPPGLEALLGDSITGWKWPRE